MLRSNEDVEMRDVEDEEEDEGEVASELDPDEGLFLVLSSFQILTRTAESSEEESEDEDVSQPISGDRNSQLTVGYKGDRSYVVRGNNIGVFNHASDNSVKYYATIGNIATTKGKIFKPKHACLSIRRLFGEIDILSLGYVT